MECHHLKSLLLYSSRKFYTNIADTDKYGKYITKSRYYGLNVFTIKDLNNNCEF